MRFRGQILVYHNAAAGKIEVIADNRGDSPGILTHCMFGDKEQAVLPAYVNGTWRSHDDYNYGHAHSVPAGQPATIKFPVGDVYVRGRGGASGEVERVPIRENTWLRVGFRQRAWGLVQIPPPGAVVALPYEKLTPNVEGHCTSQGWSAEPMSAADTANGCSDLVKQVLAMAQGIDDRHVVQGRVLITAKHSTVDHPNKLLGWEIRFTNSGQPARDDQTCGFIGTVTLLNAAGEGNKNAGLGLEAMACPTTDTEAQQYIALDGDYGRAKFGVTAKVGTTVRLGIRGWSHIEVPLPGLGGQLNIDLARFTRETSQNVPEWFDTHALQAKLGEKKGSVEFFRGGRRINDELPDTIYTGQEALTRAEFKTPPRVVVERDNTSLRVRITSQLPASDEIGPVAFVATVRIKRAGNAAKEERAYFDGDTREQVLTLPYIAGARLEIDTGPLGWRGTIDVPHAGRVDSHSTLATMLHAWVLRETDYKRAGLLPDAARIRLKDAL